MPADAPSMLRRVLFAQDTYIVPKADGRIVVGATVEAGSYDPNVTPAGLMHIMTHAMQLVPGLGDLPLEETWVGLRPTTPDKGPILGRTPWDNLFLAGGYWRNGVLLAPKTGQLLASLLSGRELSAADEALLHAFAWDRFTSPERSAAVAADTRYAASMHPIHRRKSGTGVAAAVGTELGSYSTARSAGQERSQDREVLFGSGDDALERAAELGRKDANAYDYGTDDEEEDSLEEELFSEKPSLMPGEAPSIPALTAGSSIVKSTNESIDSTAAKKYEGSVDAYTVHSRDDDDDDVAPPVEDLESIYETIKQNKAAVGEVEMGEPAEDDRKDPGFRIYYVDPVTGESHEVPPFTSPDEMAKLVQEKAFSGKHVNGESKQQQQVSPPASEEQGDSIFDGYKAIEEANKGISDEESRKAMREARMRNRGGSSSESLNLDKDSFASIRPPESIEQKDYPVEDQHDDSTEEPPPDLSEVYEKIRQNKAAVGEVEMGDAPEDDREDPGFRIYYVDPETGESHEVPPFTSPDEIVQMVQESKKDAMPAAVAASDQVNGQSFNGDAPRDNGDSSSYSETTFDGYQDIQQANSRTTRQQELEAMRAARRQNRLGGDDNIDMSKIGAQRMK